MNDLPLFHAPGKPSRIAAWVKILARLRQGPATSLELEKIAGLGYRQRVSDARAAGHTIECRAHPTIERVNVYRLVKEDSP